MTSEKRTHTAERLEFSAALLPIGSGARGEATGLYRPKVTARELACAIRRYRASAHSGKNAR